MEAVIKIVCRKEAQTGEMIKFYLRLAKHNLHKGKCHIDKRGRIRRAKCRSV